VSNSNKGDGKEGGGQVTAKRAMVMAMAMATMWAMATTIRFAGNDEGKGKIGKGNGDSNEGGGQQRG
jgi:hypothetical protein